MYTILNISDNDKHFSGAIEEYIKRMPKSVKIDTIKPTKNGTQEIIKSKDTDNIISLLENKYKNYYKVMLSIEWKTMDTMKFKDLCLSKDNVVFIIWWPYGLEEDRLPLDTKISFGWMTMPHGLAKLVLLEQIYRAECIKIWKNYHY